MTGPTVTLDQIAAAAREALERLTRIEEAQKRQEIGSAP